MIAAAREVKRSIEKQLAGLQVTAVSQNGTVLQDCDAVDADQQGALAVLGSYSLWATGDSTDVMRWGLCVHASLQSSSRTCCKAAVRPSAPSLPSRRCGAFAT